MQSSWVVKLGGSLMQSRFLPLWLDLLQEHGDRGIVIVPGGGVFADHVRQLQQRWRFNDKVAHKLALRAMEDYGLVLQALAGSLVVTRTRGEIEKAVSKGKTALWFPHDMAADNRELAASWDITSDSLALWLAEKLGIRQLLIVKSNVPVNRNFTVESLSQGGYLDAAFSGMYKTSLVKAWWLEKSRLDTLTDLLDGNRSCPDECYHLSS